MNGRNHRWDCDRQGCYAANVMPDFTWLNDCWPPGVRPTDIDMCVELRKRFLIVEWKPPGFDWDIRNEGQRLALARLARVEPFTAWVVRGERGSFEMRDMGLANDPWFPVSDEDFKLRCKRWATGDRSKMRSLR